MSTETRLDPRPYARTVLQLLSAIRTAQLHGPGNHATTTAIQRLVEVANALIDSSGGVVRIQLVDDILLVNAIRFQPRTISHQHFDTLKGFLHERGIGGVAFLRPLTEAEVREWLVVASRPVRDERDAAELRAALQRLVDLGIEVLEIQTLAGVDDFASVNVSTMSYALQTYARAVIGFRELVSALRAGRDPFSGRIHVVRVVQDLVDIAGERIDLLLKILELRRVNGALLKDSYSEVHAANTCLASILIGRLLGLDRVALLDLGTSALLADVGFALLPEALTERQSVLSPQEYAELRVFMMRAVQSLIGRGRLSDAMMRRVIVAYEHHEPQRDAHLYSRIVAVADAFDALVSGRPWRAPNEPTVALAMLRQDRQRFDPLVVETLWSLYSTAAAA